MKDCIIRDYGNVKALSPCLPNFEFQLNPDPADEENDFDGNAHLSTSAKLLKEVLLLRNLPPINDEMWNDIFRSMERERK